MKEGIDFDASNYFQFDNLHPLISMITVVEFRTKQVTGSRYMLKIYILHKLFFYVIDLNYFEHDKSGEVLVLKVIFFYVKNHYFLSFLKLRPIFCMLKAI